MGVRIFTVLVFISLLLWLAAFFGLRATYRVGQDQGVIPNLEIKQRIGLDE